MFVSIAHSPADLTIARALQTFLEAQAFQVELIGEDAWSRPRRPDGAIVALWSKESPFSPHRLAFEKLALDAWADNRLVLVKLDPHFPPVGLRDLAVIDATFENQREVVAWRSVAKRLRELQHPARQPGPSAPAAPIPVGPPQEPLKKEQPTKGGTPGSGLAILAGLAVIGAVIYLAVSLPESGQKDPLTGLALLAGVLFGGVILAGVWRRRQHSTRNAPTAGAGSTDASAPRSIFISYARVDAPQVHPICEDLTKRGQSLWIDMAEISAGENWAGEIVRAIKSVRGVAVMCSKSAFESDHVKRELYLADRYKRRIVPVFLEDAPIPEDFEYFFAGVQWLKLKDTPPGDRGKAVAKAIANV